MLHKNENRFEKASWEKFKENIFTISIIEKPLENVTNISKF